MNTANFNVRIALNNVSALVPCSIVADMISTGGAALLPGVIIQPDDIQVAFPMLTAHDCAFMAECIAYAANEGQSFSESRHNWETDSRYYDRLEFEYAPDFVHALLAEQNRIESTNY